METIPDRNAPTAFYPSPFYEFLEHVLSLSPNPSILIICSSKTDFLSLLHVVPDHSSLNSPTLENLLRARSLKLAYCDSVPALHAYLTSHSMRAATSRTKASDDQEVIGIEAVRWGIKSTAPALTIWGAIALHRRTSAYSAQGIGRFVAAAVDAATTAQEKLLLAEGRVTSARFGLTDELGGERMEVDGDEWRDEFQREAIPREDEEGEDPWTQQVPILNATTKTFGPGERGWMGRTVEIKKIVRRWCSFEYIPSGNAEGQSHPRGEGEGGTA